MTVRLSESVKLYFQEAICTLIVTKLQVRVTMYSCISNKFKTGVFDYRKI